MLNTKDPLVGNSGDEPENEEVAEKKENTNTINQRWEKPLKRKDIEEKLYICKVDRYRKEKNHQDG